MTIVSERMAPYETEVIERAIVAGALPGMLPRISPELAPAPRQGIHEKLSAHGRSRSIHDH